MALHVSLYGMDLSRLRKNAFATLCSFLSTTERHEAETYAVAAGRHRFIAFRGALRLILGQKLSLPPGDLTIVRTNSGKPVLSRVRGGRVGSRAVVGPEATNASPVEFNLSHCGDLGLVALAEAEADGENKHANMDVSVGVDIEALRPMPGAERIVQDFFHPLEVDFLSGFEDAPPECIGSTHTGPSGRTVPSGRNATEKGAGFHESFFALWTRKEAVIKCVGGEVLPALRSFSALGPTTSFPGIGGIRIVDLTDYLPAAGLPKHVFASLAVMPKKPPEILVYRLDLDFLDAR